MIRKETTGVRDTAITTANDRNIVKAVNKKPQNNSL